MLLMAHPPQPHYNGYSSRRDIAFSSVAGGLARVETACGRVSVIMVRVHTVGVKDRRLRQFELFRVQSNVELTSSVESKVKARFAQALKKNKDYFLEKSVNFLKYSVNFFKYSLNLVKAPLGKFDFTLIRSVYIMLIHEST